MELFSLLPLWYQYTVVTLLGLIIGSFLNVYIYRFHTGRSLNGVSHCLSCGTSLRWFELLPVFSYLALRGRCRSCGSYITLRYVLVELLTAFMYVVLFSTFGLSWFLLLWFVLAALLIVIVVYDLYHLIIPDELVVAVGVVTVAMFSVALWPQLNYTALLVHALGAIATFGFYGGLWRVSAGRWIGFGDAKLALPLAFLLGPMAAFSFVVLSFWVGAGISLVLLGFQRLMRRGQHRLSKYDLSLTMKSEVPFAPFLVIAFLMVAIWQVDVLNLINTFF